MTGVMCNTKVSASSANITAGNREAGDKGDGEKKQRLGDVGAARWEQ